MKITIAQAHRLSRSLSAVTRGFTAPSEKPVNLLKSAAAKLAFARNIRRLHDVLEPVEQLMLAERDRHFSEEKEEGNGEAKELSPARVAAFNRFVAELNAQIAHVDLDLVKMEDIDLDRFEGEEAILALAVLDEVVLQTAS